MEWEADEDPIKKTLSMFVKDNLRLHKSHFDQIRQEVHDLNNAVSVVKEDNKQNLEERISYNTMANI